MVYTLTAIMALVGLIWLIWTTRRVDERLAMVDQWGDDIEEMVHAVGLVLQVLNKLPEMVPQFSIQQSPLIQLMEMVQNIRSGGEPSYGDASPRDSQGRFIDGETQKQTIEEAQEIHGD